MSRSPRKGVHVASSTLEDSVVFLPWDEIRYFFEVAQAGSFNAAARRLGVNQTTVGRHIYAMEARLGAHLFDRQDTRLSLTAEGRMAFDDAARIAEAVDAFARKLSGSDSRLAGEVRINMTEGLATYWLLPRLRAFQQANPNLEITWSIGDHLLDLGREADVSIRWLKPTEPHVVARKLASARYSIYATQAYVREHGLPSSFGELERHHFLQFTGYEKNPGLKPWNELMKRIPPMMRLDNTAFTQAVFQSGTMLALLPDYAVQVDPTIIRAPVDLGISLDVWIAYHEDRRRSGRIRTLVAEVCRLAELDRGTWFS